MKPPALLRRRPFWLSAAALLLFVLALPALLAAWLPIALAPFGFRDVDARLSLPGLGHWEAEHLAFAWDGPDGLRLRLAGDGAVYDYGDDALRLASAELSLEAWPLRAEAGPDAPPLSEWPLLPLRRLEIEHLRLRFPVGGLSKQAEGRLKAELKPEGGASLVLYMAQGLPDELPGRFELAIAPDARLKATAGLSRGKTTVFFTELHLDAPPAHAPAFRLRSAGDLRPFYRWLKLGVPEEAQVKLNLAGRLPPRLDRRGWLEQGEVAADFAVEARRWALPWGLAENLRHRGTLDYRQARGRVSLQGDALDARGIALPPFHLDGVFQSEGEELQATGLVDSAPLKTGYHLRHAPAQGRGELRLTGLEADLARLWPLLKPHLPAGLRDLAIDRGGLSGEATLPWRAGQPGKDLTLRLAAQDLAGRYQGLSWQQGAGMLQLDRAEPLSATASMTLGRLQLPAEFALSELRGEFAAGGRWDAPVLNVQKLTASGLGGRFAVAPFEWRAGAPLALTLDAESLELAAVLALAGQPALTGEGRVSGRLPLSFRDGQPSLGEGAGFTAQGGGALRYAPGPASKDENIGLKALRDFRYKRLGADLRYAPDGAYGIRLELEGANPALYNGYPIAFTLNLEGRLPDLLRAALLSGDFAGHVLNSLTPQAQQGPPGS